MILMPRLTISRNNKIGDETPVKNVSEIDFENEDEQCFLLLDGKPTHRFVQCTNADPQSIDELDSKVIILMPLQPWCALCLNKKAYKEGLGMFRLNGDETVPSALVVESTPFHDKKERPNVLNAMMEKINSNIKPLLNTIEKNNDRGR